MTDTNKWDKLDGVPDEAFTATPGESAEWDMSGGDDGGWNVDFSKAEIVPTGVLLLQITKYTRGKSKQGNRKIDVQLKVQDGEGGAFNGRMVFDTVTLTENSIFRAKKFAKAFLGDTPAGDFSFANDAAFLGQQAWCLVVAEAGQGEYAGTNRARVQTYGVKAPEA